MYAAYPRPAAPETPLRFSSYSGFPCSAPVYSTSFIPSAPCSRRYFFTDAGIFPPSG